MPLSDVAITGIGMVTPLGGSFAETSSAWISGLSAMPGQLAGLSGTAAAMRQAAVPDVSDNVKRLGGGRMLKYMSEAGLYGSLAAREALSVSDALRRFAPERIGLYAATGLAAVNPSDVQRTIDASIDDAGNFACGLFGSRGLSATNPLLSFKILANMPPCIVSIMEGIKGPNFIFSPWEGQAAAALEEAWRAVSEGEVDAALVGAADSPANPSVLVYLIQSGLISEDEFPSSGAGYLLLESSSTAERDGVRTIAYLSSVSVSNDGSGPCDPIAHRMGRMYAAAPPVLLGLSCIDHTLSCIMSGVGGQGFSALVKNAA